ncbi:major allergen Pru av 1-like [Quercus robur]|uniref:major allergen Pru av 1-like n=1 Tax=Quercus lobata TaxID=97700 RepID=UPI001245D290|nr:major allergen Pru av 1-like [Quercus lobata]XP_050239885.1 major allergen Pru av 1-like [Quercus robur]
MGVFTHESQGTSAIPPARLFKAFILDGDNLIPKVVPQAVKSVERIEGNGGPGTIRKITFGEGSKYKYGKHRIDVMDPEHYTCCFSVIEGDGLSDNIENISTETKIVASPDGGSIVKRTSKYQTKGDFQLTEEHFQGGKERATMIFKGIETYLVAHPDLYN